jgi:hypothetical protein
MLQQFFLPAFASEIILYRCSDSLLTLSYHALSICILLGISRDCAGLRKK